MIALKFEDNQDTVMNVVTEKWVAEDRQLKMKNVVAQRCFIFNQNKVSKECIMVPFDNLYYILKLNI